MMQAPRISMQLTLDEDNSYEAGSSLRGIVKLQALQNSPDPNNICFLSQAILAGNEFEEKKEVGAVKRNGTLAIMLEGFEKTAIIYPGRARGSMQSYLYGPTIIGDEFRFVHVEKEYIILCDAKSEVEFDLILPSDLPSSLGLKDCAFLAPKLSGRCSIFYHLTATFRDCSNHLVSSKEVKLQKKSQAVKHQSLPLAVSSMVEVPTYFCGFIEIFKTKTFSLNHQDIDLLHLRPNQRLQLIIQDADDTGTLGLNGTHSNILFIKLTQKTQIFARNGHWQPHETPVHFHTWDLPVDAKGMVSIPGASPNMTNLNMSYKSKLIHFQHELIVYVVNSTKFIVATSPPIPVIVSPE